MDAAVSPDELESLLTSIRSGATSVAEGLERLRTFPVLDVGHSRLDLQRELRCGHPEVVFGAGKTPDELVDVVRALVERHGRALATRVEPAGAELLQSAFPEAEHRPRARLVAIDRTDRVEGAGSVVVASAGTSDGPVAEEAAETARFLGARVSTLPDVGVAGLHRLLAGTETLRDARAVVVVAGMEGALPSVVGGLVDRPVIAVPTSVGYGASFGGLAALLAMLSSCAPGVTVVNVDNGFGAGYAAAQINRLAESRPHDFDERRE